ncbi:MAG: TolC family protein [Planctomycetia bacterium]|nr:TolC family protein [Planctomycetia bacterium]
MPRFLVVALLLSGCAAPALRHFDDARASREPALPPAPSEEGLEASFTLETAIALARAKSPGLREARLRVSAARERIGREGSLEEPRLALEAGPVAWSGPGQSRSEWMAGVRQMLPFPGNFGLRADAAAAEALASLEESLEAGNAVETAVEGAFFDLVQAERELEVRAEHERILEDVLRVAEAHYRAGRVMQSDVLKAQAALVKLRNEVVFVKLRAATSRLRLNVLMGREAGAPLGAPAAPAARWSPGTAEEAEALAASGRPELRAAGHMLAAAESGEELARREEWLPEVEFGVDYVRRPMDDRDAWRAMLVLNLPWFGAGRHAARREAEHTAAARRAGLEARRLESAREAREAFLNARAARESLALQTRELVPAARQAFEAVRTDYENNAASFLDLLDALTTLLEAQVGAQKAEADHGKAVAELLRAVGGSQEERR